ncbi:MAG: thiamine pyrophosphate-binding protein [Roseovarius sp.]|nr:thiamine pyrophosphate-binding protein [Roseovarius sp.]
MSDPKSMTGDEAAVEALKAEGTSHVFGVIGSATMEMFGALYDARDIRFIGVLDERTGTHMADGLAQANAAYAPVVSIAGGAGIGACLSRCPSGSGPAGAVQARQQEDMDRDRRRPPPRDVPRSLPRGDGAAPRPGPAQPAA